VEDVEWMDLAENMGQWEALVNMKRHSEVNRRWHIPELQTDFQDTLTNSVEANVHTSGVFLEGLSFNFGWKNGCHGSRIYGYPQIHQHTSGQCTELGHAWFHPYPLQFIIDYDLIVLYYCTTVR